MTKKLAADGLVVRIPYRGVTLTEPRPADRARGAAPPPAARALPRRRARAAARRGARRGRPARARALGGARGADRRGARLPDARSARRPDPGRRARASTRRCDARCSRLEPGERTTVVRVPDHDADLLRYLGELALVPGATRRGASRRRRSAGRSRSARAPASTRSRASSRPRSPSPSPLRPARPYASSRRTTSSSCGVETSRIVSVLDRRHAVDGAGPERNASPASTISASTSTAVALLAELELRAARVDEPRLVLLAVELERQRLAGLHEEHLAARTPRRRPRSARGPTASRPCEARTPSVSESCSVMRADPTPAIRDARPRARPPRAAPSAC